jgi:hypothetical protein
MTWSEIQWPPKFNAPALEEESAPILVVQTIEQLPEEEPPVIIPGLARQGEVILIGGHAKSWKSWALLDLLYCISNGIQWLRFPAASGIVFHVDLELAPWDIRYRFTEIQNSYEAGNFNNIRVAAHRGKPLGLGDLALLPDELDWLAPALLSLDPSYRLLAGENESDPGIITELMNKMLELGTKLNSAIALLQHFSKGNQADKEAIDRFSGSGVYSRHPDALITFSQHEDENCFTVNFILRSFPPLDPFVVKWEYPRFRIADDRDPERLKQARTGRPRLNTAEQLASLIGLQESISYSDWLRRAQKICDIKERTFARRLGEAKNQHLVYLSPLNNEYSLTPEYMQRNGR